MGGLYLGAAGRRAGGGRRPCDWHYHPVHLGEDALPAGVAGRAVRSASSRLSRWPTSSTRSPATSALGLVPTGSSDPFGLAPGGAGRASACSSTSGTRRTGEKPASTCEALVDGSGRGLRQRRSDQQPTSARDLEGFLLDRLAYVLESRGFPADEVRRGLLTPGTERARRSAGTAWCDCARCTACAREASEDFDAPRRRLQARQEHPDPAAGGGRRSSPGSSSTTPSGSCTRRWPRPGARTATTRRGCARSPALRKPVDRFFDDVLVMAEDPKVRGNRLGLLQRDAIPFLSHRGHLQARRAVVDPIRLLLRRRQGGRQQGHEGPARRQGGRASPR